MFLLSSDLFRIFLNFHIFDTWGIAIRFVCVNILELPSSVGGLGRLSVTLLLNSARLDRAKHSLNKQSERLFREAKKTLNETRDLNFVHYKW